MHGKNIRCIFKRNMVVRRGTFANYHLMPMWL